MKLQNTWIRTMAALLIVLASAVSVWWSTTPASAQGSQVQVTAAVPASAEQGTINLNVKVNGKGFKNGANARWFVTGTTDTGGVTVNSTTFVSSTELTANITVSDTAVIANFDIQVSNPDGRGGKGTELFAVTAKGNGGSCINLALSPDGGTTAYAASSTTAAVPCSPASVIPGSLDTCFGSNGIVATSISPNNWATGIALQPDGKSVVAVHGANPDGVGSDFYAARFDAAGNLDPTFGGTGVVRLQFTSCADAEFVYAIAVQSDGKILLAGYAYIKSSTYGFAVARLNSDGSLDSTFGNAGRVFFGFSQSAILRAITLQLDRKIVLAGSQGMDFALARLNSDGTLDNTFGAGGKVVVQTVRSSTDTLGAFGANAVLIQTVNGQERVLAAGMRPATNKLSRDFALLRLTPSGALDTSFGSNGQVYTDFYGYMDRVDALAVVGNSIIAAGLARRNTSVEGADFGLAKYTLDGDPDSAFGMGGKVVTDILGTENYIEGIAVQTDGKIVAGGNSFPNNSSGDFVLVRYHTNGTLDSSFGLSGVALTDFSSRDSVTGGVAFQTDGRIVLAGLAGTSSSATYVLLTRYMP